MSKWVGEWVLVSLWASWSINKLDSKGLEEWMSKLASMWRVWVHKWVSRQICDGLKFLSLLLNLNAYNSQGSNGQRTLRSQQWIRAFQRMRFTLPDDFSRHCFYSAPCHWFLRKDHYPSDLRCERFDSSYASYRNIAQWGKNQWKPLHWLKWGSLLCY